MEKRQEIETGVPFWQPMAVGFSNPPVLNEAARGVTNATNNIDVNIFSGITDLVQAKVQFSLQGGRSPALWSLEKIPILSLIADWRAAFRRQDLWSKPFYLRHGRRLEGQFVNLGAEGAGTVVFVGDQLNDSLASIILVDLQAIGEMGIMAVDSKFTNTAGEQPAEEFSAPQTWDFLVQGFYSELERADVRIKDAENRDWNGDWTPIWAIAGNNTSATRIRKLRRPYVLPRDKSFGVRFRNHATVPEPMGRLWIYGQRLQRPS